jgi:YfiH family protein
MTPLLNWDAPGPYRVAFSTRNGGVSQGPFATLNLGRMLGDDPKHVDENRGRLCAAVGVDLERLAMNFQRHSAVVNRASPGLRGEPGDALVTDEPRLPMLVLTADCLPVAIVRTNGDRPGAAVVHAGWQGLLEGVVEQAAAALGGKLAAVIGPAIGPCCYEVRDDVGVPLQEKFGADVLVGGKADLWTAAERALGFAGCESVERLDLCTACNPELFFSYRRDGKPRGGQGVIAVVDA